MKYIALIYSNPETDQSPDYGTPEFGPYMARWSALTEKYIADGVMGGGEALEPPSTATSVKLRGGKVETMDGPFAETKEQLGGYYILDCENLDEAIRYAAMIPTAEYGTIEVRPVMDLSGVS